MSVYTYVCVYVCVYIYIYIYTTYGMCMYMTDYVCIHGDVHIILYMRLHLFYAFVERFEAAVSRSRVPSPLLSPDAAGG